MLVRLLLAVCFTQFIFAQEQIVKGIVLFEGIPLEGASVIVKDFNVGTITDASGAFSLTLSNIKNPKITISYLGYKSFNLKITKISNDLGNIELVSDDKLDEVVISGTLKPVSRLKSPVSVEVYAESFFKANPTSSIFEALDIINGVRPQLNCNVCSTGDIHINGQEGSYTMILIDGLPIVSGLSSVYGLSGIPQSLIERIEIIKGPASTLYGSEAIGGVINLITKIPENASRFSFDSFTSNWGDLNLDLGHQYRLSKKINGLLGVNYFKYSNPVDNNSDGFTDLTLQDRISVFNKLNIGKRLSFASRFVYEDRWGGEMNWNPTFRGGDLVYGESIYTSRVELFGTYKFNNEISFQFSFNDHNQNSVYGTTLFKADQSIAFGQFIWNRTIKKHDLVIGAAYRFTFYDDNTTATFNEFLGINKEEITQLPGVFIQDEIQFNEQNSLLLGFRYDYNSIHGTIFTPRLNYKISNQDLSSILRISIGSGYRIAQIFTEDHAALTGARDVVFLNDLKPEMSADEVTANLTEAIESKNYDFIVANYANPDMVGHTGNLTAAVKACEAVDKGLGLVLSAIKNSNGILLITADHGNCEVMYDNHNNMPHTAHTLSLVPFIISGLDDSITLRHGGLSDIAPTILEILSLKKPKEMTGESLIKH